MDLEHSHSAMERNDTGRDKAVEEAMILGG
jgi:hypothetical protein